MSYTKIFIDFIVNLRDGVYTPSNQNEVRLLEKLQEPVIYDDQAYILGHYLRQWLYDYVEEYSITMLQDELLTYATDIIDYYKVVNYVISSEGEEFSDVTTNNQGFSTGETYHTSLVINNESYYSNLIGEHVLYYANNMDKFKETINLDIKSVLGEATYSDKLIPRFISQIIKNIHYTELV